MKLQITFNTVSPNSIISYLVSFYQMLSSAKPDWFAAEMKDWQTAIHHWLSGDVWICVRRARVCVHERSLRGSEMKDQQTAWECYRFFDDWLGSPCESMYVMFMYSFGCVEGASVWLGGFSLNSRVFLRQKLNAERAFYN